jgi:hypothetical protein
MICSGVLSSEADGIARAFAPVGLRELERRISGDWTALSMTTSSTPATTIHP